MSQKSYQYLSVGTKIGVGFMIALLLKENTEALKSLPVEMDDPSHNLWMIPAFWVGVLAPGFYLAGLWCASDVFARMNKGDAFGPAMITGLKDVGANLMRGAAAAVFIAPTLIFLMENQFQRLTGMKYHFEVESLTIGLIGLILYLLAKQGGALKAELEHFV